jgi:hypothetical protein
MERREFTFALTLALLAAPLAAAGLPGHHRSRNGRRQPLP